MEHSTKIHIFKIKTTPVHKLGSYWMHGYGYYTDRQKDDCVRIYIPDETLICIENKVIDKFYIPLEDFDILYENYRR